MPRIRKPRETVNRPPVIEAPYTTRTAKTAAEMWGESCTDFYVELESTSEPHMPVVWLRIERRSRVPADRWGKAERAEIIVRANEVDVLLDTIAAVVAEGRRTGVLAR